jgi:hypothetical protein
MGDFGVQPHVEARVYITYCNIANNIADQSNTLATSLPKSAAHNRGHTESYM